MNSKPFFLRPWLKPRLRPWILSLSSLALLLGVSCDWGYFHLVNSIPVRGNPEKNPVVHVYLGVDGLPHSLIPEAQAAGVFSSQEWNHSPLIAIFPATSDAAWTRIFRTRPLPGYEFHYYDANKDQLVHGGLAGTALHVIPPILPHFPEEPPYMKGFDFKGAGYSHPMAAYVDAERDYADTLDHLFSLLSGRSEGDSIFTGYVLNLDVIGHMQERSRMVDALITLGKRIQKFKEDHPERKFVFTLFSDHGMDFVPVKPQDFIRFQDELKALGITPVNQLAGQDPSQGLFAIPIIHTRVSYVALHTHPSLAEEIARKTSESTKVDLTIAKATAPHFVDGMTWYGVFTEGHRALLFGYHERQRTYLVSCESDLARVGINLNCRSKEEFIRISDSESLRLSQMGTYPDLFHRTRTALSPIGVKYPADVLVSFRHPYASRGFELPGGQDGLSSSYSFHGAMEGPGSTGVILTEEKSLPAVVRTDDFLDYFPLLRNYLISKGVAQN